MGRYYNCNESQIEGKFMFGVQPSEDVGTIFGGEPSEPETVDYWFTTEDETVERVRGKLGELYDELGVKGHDRLLNPETTTERDIVLDHISKLVWKTVKRSEIEGTPWALPDFEKDRLVAEGKDPKDYVQQEIDKGRCLVFSRISLGLDILLEIKTARDNGLDSCCITAEMM